VEWLEPYRDGWLIGLTAVNAVLLLLWIVANVRLKRLKEKLKSLLGGSDAIRLEEANIRSHELIAELKDGQRHHEEQIEAVKRQLAAMKAKTALIRYNALQEGGHDLSFSLAIVDQNGNGLVLTNIRTRHDSHLYAKPLENGRSGYALSPEEQEAINQALRS